MRVKRETMISCDDDACEEDIHSIIDMTTTNRFSSLPSLSLSQSVACSQLPCYTLIPPSHLIDPLSGLLYRYGLTLIEYMMGGWVISPSLSESLDLSCATFSLLPFNHTVLSNSHRRDTHSSPFRFFFFQSKGRERESTEADQTVSESLPSDSLILLVPQPACSLKLC